MSENQSRRYAKSEALLDRALKTIPLGSQTFSKSKVQYPLGVSPFFMARGKGSQVWDVDGNQYTDFVNSLASITLGYGDEDVNAAVKAQLEDGIIFSLPHELEMKVAEQIVEMVPCAEKVRFGKNGSDATSGAIRLARAFTGREHVAICGYHGWQDWYIGATALNRGVPESTRALTHRFNFNDLASFKTILDKTPGQLAAVIIEPLGPFVPDALFLENIQAMTREAGALLIFDETITGFRVSNGGAQEYLKVIPDLATFGKGLANGYPVSAIAGRADVMHLMEEIFFSFTFGGELLSLAAAHATLKKLKEKPVVKQLWQTGSQVLSGVKERIAAHGISEIVEITGLPVWTFLHFKDFGSCTQWQIKSLFMQEILARGIITIGTHNVSYAHTPADVAHLLKVYDEVFPLLKRAVLGGEMNTLLRCKPIEPLFKLR